MVSLREIIENRSIPVTEAGCWIWTASKSKQGYGDFRIHGRHYTAHRASYLAFKGEIPSGMHVLHKCDTRSCCNPDHLMLGSNKDNVVDCCKKGRNSNVISNSQVEELRRRARDGETVTALSKEFGISLCYASAIKTGRARFHVPGETFTHFSRSEEIKQAIKREHKENSAPLKDLAEKYGVAYSTARKYARSH